MKFLVETNNDACYTSVLETIVGKGLLHSKEQRGGLTCLEIEGSPADFLEIKGKIERMNESFKYIVGVIIEGV